MPDWIEFSRLKENGEIWPTSIRVYSIEAVDKISDGSAKIYMDDERHYSYTIAEPYEEVMKRIIELEAPIKVITPMHFTKDEYQFMYNCLSLLCETSTKEKKLQPILNKLKEILEEEE